MSGSYGFSLILLSLVVNIALIPLYRLADKWQEAERKIQDLMSGEIDSIKKYYSGKKRYFQIKAVYRRYGYSPLNALKVSLGLLIQIPFFFAAYHLLNSHPNLRGTTFLFIENLGSPDNLLYGLNILPVIMTFVSIASGIIYSRNMTASQKAQLHSLSFIFLIILYNMPSGLVLYWTINNTISFVKNIIKYIKTQDASEMISKYKTEGFHAFINSPVSIRYTSYFVFALLFMIMVLTTFHYSFGYKYRHYALAGASIKVSVFLLLALITVIAPGLAKRYIRSTKGFFMIICAGLLTIIGIILLGLLLKNHGITSSMNFYFLCLLLTSLVLLNNYYKLLRDDYGIDILEPLRPVQAYNQKNFMLSLLLFHIIYFLWGPILTIYGASSDEFLVSFLSIMLWQLIFFLASFIIIHSLYYVSHQLIKNALTFILQFLSLTAIIYLVFNQRVLGLMDHFKLKQEELLHMEQHEIFLEYLLLYIVLLCIYFFLRYASDIMNRVINFLMIIILLSSVYYFSHIFQNTAKENKILPVSQYELNLSKSDTNVLILILDGFSGGAIKYLEDNKPESLESLDGFAWYRNILTTSTGTRGSMAALYGGHKFTIEQVNKNPTDTIFNYFKKAHNLFPREFAKFGYTTVYSMPSSIDCKDMNNIAACYNSYLTVDETAPVYSTPLLVNAITTFKSVPHMFQQYIYDNGRWQGIVKSRFLINIMKKEAMWNYLYNLKDIIKIVNTPTLNIIKFFIPHAPNIMDSQCNFTQRHNASYYLNDSYCAIIAVNQLVAQMKDLEVYDNTMIVLVSDHGWSVDNKMFNEELFSKKVPAGHENRLRPGVINPLLMVKDINSRRSFEISDVFLSNADLPSIVCTVIGSCEGVPPDFRYSKGDRVLTVNDYHPKNELTFLTNRGFGPVKSRYEVTDNIFDASNWKKIR